MKKLKKIISLLLSIVMIASAFFCVDLSALAANVNVTNRAEWLTELVKTFDMTVESDEYPDNYFSDLTEDSEYYEDILIAVEFGLVDVEAGDPVDPNGKITREFAAQTLNFCLGFELDKGSTSADGEAADGSSSAAETQYEYTFADWEDCLYPDDDQIAVNRGWFALDENGNFCPDQEVTESEITFMINDASEVIGKDTVEENYNSAYEFADYVVEIPQDTDISINENNIVTITDCPSTVNAGDTFVVYANGIPSVYLAETIETDANVTTIVTSEADVESAIVSVDMQEISNVNASAFEPVEGLEVVQPKTYSAFDDDLTITDDSITVAGEIEISGVSVGLAANISNIVLGTKIDTKNNEYVALVSFDSELSTELSVELADVDIPLGTISVFGVGSVALSINVDLDGKASIVQKYSSAVGFSYSEDDGVRKISDFVKKDFSVVLQVSGKVGLKLSAAINVLVLKAEIYSSIGLKVDVKSENYTSGSPRKCNTVQAYLYADSGFEFTALFVFKHSVEWEFLNEDNSPVRLYYHIEDGNKVDECKRGDDVKYLTPDDSAYGTIDSEYYYNEYIASLFTYRISNGEAVITGLAKGYEPQHLDMMHLIIVTV